MAENSRIRSVSFRLLAVIAVLAGMLASTSTAVSAVNGASLSPNSDVIWDVSNPDLGVRHTGQLRALVWDLQEHQGRMLVAGKFLNVKAPDGTLHDQPYLAAFDLNTGAWIQSFRPQVDGAIYAMDIGPGGRLIVGGEIPGGVAAYNAMTGVRDNTFSPGISNSWGPPAVFDVEVHQGSVYVGGTFTSAQGTALSNLAKIDLGNGSLDTTWLPTAQQDLVTPRLGGRLVYGLSIDPGRQRIYVVGKFGAINQNTDAAYFATLNLNNGQLRNDVPQGLPKNILNHRESFSMWMHDVQWRGNKVYVGGQGHQTLTLNAADLSVESSFFTNRGVGDLAAGGDTQVIFLGENTIWSGCHCWGSVGNYPLGVHIADPGGLQTYDEYVTWVREFRDVNLYGQQKVKGAYGLNIASGQLVPLTFNVTGKGGAWAIYEDSLGRVWFGGHYESDTQTGRQIEGLVRFSATQDGAGPTGLRTTRQTKERIVLNWSAFTGATAYNVYADGQLAGTVSGRWFTHLGLSSGTSYTYTVRAVLGNQTLSAPSAPLVVSTEGNVAAQPVTGLRTTRQTRERIVLNWNQFPGAVSYEVSANGTTVGSPSGVWFTNVGLTAGTSYNYSVVAVFADGTKSDPSAVLTVATAP